MTATRLGIAPDQRKGTSRCDTNACPDVFQVSEADKPECLVDGPVYAIIGTLATAEQVRDLNLPPDAGVAEDEALVFVPQDVLLAAAKQMLAPQGKLLP